MKPNFKQFFHDMSFYWISLAVVVVGVGQGQGSGNYQLNPILGPHGYLRGVKLNMTVSYVNNMYPSFTVACTSTDVFILEAWNQVTQTNYDVPNGLSFQDGVCEFTPSDYACIEDLFKNGPYSACEIPGTQDLTVVSSLSLTLGTTTTTFSTNDIPPILLKRDIGQYSLGFAIPNNLISLLEYL